MEEGSLVLVFNIVCFLGGRDRHPFKAYMAQKSSLQTPKYYSLFSVLALKAILIINYVSKGANATQLVFHVQEGIGDG